MKTTNHLRPYIYCRDYVVSGEPFQLLHDKELEMLITSPQPSPSELELFYESENYISHTDRRQKLYEKIYSLVRCCTLRRKIKLVNKLAETGKLLDVGCGTGHFLKTAQKRGWKVTGIEPNEKARAIANEKTNNAVFDLQDLETLPEHSFDVITLWHALEHLPELEENIQQFKNLLKPKGTLIVAVPNFKSFDARYYQQFWAAYDVPRHLWHFSKKAIQKIFAEYKMKVTQILPMKFDSYYVSLLSEKYKTGKTKFLKAFYIGLQSNLKAKRSGAYSSLTYILKNE